MARKICDRRRHSDLSFDLYYARHNRSMKTEMKTAHIPVYGTYINNVVILYMLRALTRFELTITAAL